jgi:hypothetical protein
MPYKDLEKQKQAKHESYLRNREKVYLGSRSRRRKTLQDIVDLKESNPCVDCGEFYPYWVMEFDHIKGEKNMNVSRIARSGGSLKISEEIAKCELVCANCHANRTYKRASSIQPISFYECVVIE